VDANDDELAYLDAVLLFFEVLVRNSVLQVRKHTNNEYAERPRPPFQRDQDGGDEAWARPHSGYSDHEDENGGWRFGLD